MYKNSTIKRLNSLLFEAIVNEYKFHNQQVFSVMKITNLDFKKGGISVSSSSPKESFGQVQEVLNSFFTLKPEPG